MLLMDNKLRNKTLLVCGIICSICGLVIFAVSLLASEHISTFNIYLGVINIINGGLFLGLSLKK